MIHMGKLEKENKKQIRATKIQGAILKTIAAAGIMSVALLAPNALQMLKLFGFDKKSIRNKVTAIHNSQERLIDNGLVKCSPGGLLFLTQKGQNFLRKIERNNYKIEKPRRWDKKWRILIFDIKEENKNARDQMRRKLSLIGFIRLQNSVWVYPYDSEDFINLLKADFSMGREVLYIIADKIENEEILLKKFNLKK